MRKKDNEQQFGHDIRIRVIIYAACLFFSPGAVIAGGIDEIVRDEWDKLMVKDAGYKPAARPSVMCPVPVRIPQEVPSSGFSTADRVSVSGRMKLSEAMRLFSSVLRQNILLGPGVEDREIVINIMDQEIRQGLKSVLYPLGYGCTPHGGELIVLSRVTRVFHLPLPPVDQSFRSLTTNESMTSGTGKSFGAPMSSLSAAARVKVGARVTVENSSGRLSLWDDIERNLKALVSPQGNFTVNRSAGMVSVEDAPLNVSRIEAFLNEMATRVSLQIIADVKVVEVELNEGCQLGIDWSALMNHGILKGLKFTANFATENFSAGNVMTLSAGKGGAENSRALLNALADFGRVDVLSQPRVVMLNNSVANIQVGTSRSYIDSTSVQALESGSVLTAAALSEVHGGVTLQIMGNVSGDDIYLSITPVVSSIDEIRSISLGQGNRLEAPETSMKSMSTLVRVRNGETVAVGGLITSENAKRIKGVPFLSRIPLIGKVFSYERQRRARKELVVFITPKKG
jgi:MSHA type pilus biogenesis protein MshL